MNAYIQQIDSYEYLTIEDIRKEISDIIQTIIPNATIHDEWRTEFDTDSGLRKVTPLLYGQNADSGIIHSWQVAVSAAAVIRGETNTFDLVGSDTQYGLIFNVDIWGFFDYSQITGCWTKAENETRLIQATLNRNRSNLFRGHPKAGYFQQMFPFDMNSLDIEPFADGNNVIVSQNLTQIEIREILN